MKPTKYSEKKFKKSIHQFIVDSFSSSWSFWIMFQMFCVRQIYIFGVLRIFVLFFLHRGKNVKMLFDTTEWLMVLNLWLLCESHSYSHWFWLSAGFDVYIIGKTRSHYTTFNLTLEMWDVLSAMSSWATFCSRIFAIIKQSTFQMFIEYLRVR